MTISPQKKAQLIWHCRRGMLELDLILSRFVKQHLDELTADQLKAFERLLMCADPDLYCWLMGYAKPDDKECDDIIQVIMHSHSVK